MQVSEMGRNSRRTCHFRTPLVDWQAVRVVIAVLQTSLKRLSWRKGSPTGILSQVNALFKDQHLSCLPTSVMTDEFRVLLRLVWLESLIVMKRHGYFRWAALPGGLPDRWVCERKEGGGPLRARAVRGEHHPEAVSSLRPRLGPVMAFRVRAF